MSDHTVVGGSLFFRGRRRSSHRDSASALLGVAWSKSSRKFRARIWSAGKEVHLGVFNTPEQAHEAYLAAKRRLHAGCTI